MRFFFHMRSRNGDEPDDEGLEFETLDAAVDEAEETAREMVAERVMHQERIEGTRFEIADEQGNILATVPFRESYQSRLANSPAIATPRVSSTKPLSIAPTVVTCEGSARLVASRSNGSGLHDLHSNEKILTGIGSGPGSRSTYSYGGCKLIEETFSERN